ncbi:MAG: hypothetical protein R2867_06715 [Caldilineaceae bacterium]
MLAYAQRALGGVLADRGDLTLVKQSYQQATRLFEQLGITTEAKATAELVEALQ